MRPPVTLFSGRLLKPRGAQRPQALELAGKVPAVQTFAATALPETFDADKLTFEVVFYSGAKVLRQRFFDDPFELRLSLAPDAVRMGRIQSGRAAFTIDHARSIRDTIGIIESASLGADARARVRLSQRDDVAPIAMDIQAGILKSVSMEAAIYATNDVTEKTDKLEQIEAIDWEPMAVSLVSVGADADAEVLAALEASGRTYFLPEAQVEANQMDNQDPETSVDATGAGEAELEQARTETLEQERARVSTITDECQRVGLADNAKDYIQRGLTVEAFRGELLDAIATRAESNGGEGHGQYHVGEGQVEKLQLAAVEAVIARGGHVPGMSRADISDSGREVMGMSLIRLAEAVLEARNPGSTRGKGPMGIATLAFHSTSDFPSILADIQNKTLRAGYDETPRTWMPFTRETTANDFKTIQRTQLGEAPSLLKVPEGAEITEGTIGDAKERYALATYARIFSVTRQTLINDDLDALSRMPFMYGAAASRLESDLVWGILTANAVMDDGIALFHASHGNLETGDVGQASFTAMRKAARLQTGVGGVAKLNIDLRYLMVPPSQEVDALKETTLITPAQSSNVNVFQGAFDAVIVEARLEDTSTTEFYMSARPGQIDTLELARLVDSPVPRIESQIGFEIDGVRFKAAHDCAAAAIDYRGLVKSSGV